MNILARLSRKHARSRLRNILRGYRILKSENKLSAISELKRELTFAPLDRTKYRSLRDFWQIDDVLIERSVRQYLLEKFGGLNLNAAILVSIGKNNAPIVFPLPIEWRIIFKRRGYLIAEFKSSVLWICLVGIFFLKGVLNYIEIILLSIKNVFSKKKYHEPIKYTYFIGLTKQNVPSKAVTQDGYDIFSWYANWDERSFDTKFIRHDVFNANKVTVNELEVEPGLLFRPLSKINSIIQFITWGVKILIAIPKSLTFNSWWWCPLMFGELVRSKLVSLADPNDLAADYLFHNSNYIYQPIWTYAAESMGSRIIFYFYSTNCEPWVHNNKRPPLPYGWGAMSWPLYLVWDTYQAEFIFRCVGRGPKITVVGPINFSSDILKLEPVPEKNIAVFDVQPMRDTHYRTLGMDFEYYIPSHANLFLEDIFKICKQLGLAPVLKRKRNIGRLAHPFYRSKLAELKSSSLYYECDSEFPTQELIKKSSAVISAPYTSTAIIAKFLGKHSVYYDPTGLCTKSDRASHGIQLLSGREELFVWLTALKKGS